MQKARGRGSGPLPQLADGWFQVLFHSPSGVLFTFPSRYWFAIGRQLVFSLGGWALRIRTGFHVSRPTWDASGSGRAARTGLSPAMAGLSRPLRLLSLAVRGPATPADESAGLGFSAFARRYLRNHFCFLLLGVLRCFTSPGFASHGYGFTMR